MHNGLPSVLYVLQHVLTMPAFWCLSRMPLQTRLAVHSVVQEYGSRLRWRLLFTVGCVCAVCGCIVAPFTVCKGYERGPLSKGQYRAYEARRVTSVVLCLRAKSKRYSRPCLPLLWPRLYAEPFGLGEKRRPAMPSALLAFGCL